MSELAFADLVRVKGPLVLQRYSFAANGQISVTLPDGTWGGVIKEEPPGVWIIDFWGYGVFWLKDLGGIRIVPKEECPPPNWEMRSQEEGWVAPRSR